jgi:hypothetical protein
LFAPFRLLLAIPRLRRCCAPESSVSFATFRESSPVAGLGSMDSVRWPMSRFNCEYRNVCGGSHWRALALIGNFMGLRFTVHLSAPPGSAPAIYGGA